MVKLLLIIGITVYVLYKVGSFLFKIGAASEQLRNNQSANMGGNAPGQKAKKKPNIPGEYVDYEEVK